MSKNCIYRKGCKKLKVGEKKDEEYCRKKNPAEKSGAAVERVAKNVKNDKYRHENVAEKKKQISNSKN